MVDHETETFRRKGDLPGGTLEVELLELMEYILKHSPYSENGETGSWNIEIEVDSISLPQLVEQLEALKASQSHHERATEILKTPSLINLLRVDHSGIRGRAEELIFWALAHHFGEIPK